MAITMTVLNAPNGGDNSQRRTILEGTATLSGSYATGGESVTWTGLKDVSGSAVLLNSLQANPIWVEMYTSSNSGTALLIPILYNYSTNKFQIYVSSSGAELGAGAYTGSYSTVTFYWKAEFPNEI